MATFQCISHAVLLPWKDLLIVSAAAQSRRKQGNMVETSAVRPAPKLHPREPQSPTGSAWIHLCTKILQAKQPGTEPLGGLKASILTALHTVLFSHPF